MAEGDRDEMLRDMAANRGCKLVKSRRRTPGVGDYGRYGLKDAETGADVLGIGRDGLTASAEEIEDYLRGRNMADWKSSLAAAAAPEEKKLKARKPAKVEAPAPKARPAKVAPPPPPEPPPEPELHIREATLEDAEAIAKLVTQLGFPSSTKEIAARLPGFFTGNEPPLVAEKDGVIGCLTWHVTPALHRPHPVGRVTMLIVAEGQRGGGVGKALLDCAEKRLRERGCLLIEVTSNIELGGAHAFYKRQGYERTSYRFAKKVAD
ncbi:MAG: GNAT family N-acetyltransferase [Alphaproteobacteria bacterium]|nr:MAG: GNAT family N-acetyltransferase [Alphaproteobacteria bacterium]